MKAGIAQQIELTLRTVTDSGQPSVGARAMTTLCMLAGPSGSLTGAHRKGFIL